MILEQHNEILVEQRGAVGILTLNRPDSLNALTLDMIRILSATLHRWENDDSIRAVFILGAGEKAFCAGGDVKRTYSIGMACRQGQSDERVNAVFFGEEYSLNRQIYCYKKPLFAFMDGIIMGGGFGIAGPCLFRIISDKTVFAMPEVRIGFFPDVGSTYFLNRCPGEIGTYLALTGETIALADIIYSQSIASHYVPSEKWDDCLDALYQALEKEDSDSQVVVFDNILVQYADSVSGQGDLEQHRSNIDKCFEYDTIEQIFETLRELDSKANSAWARQTLALMEARSPLSLKVSLAHLRRAKDMDFHAITGQDFILSQRFMLGHDFYEGIRAQVISKDRCPRWDPVNLSEVSEEDVALYFKDTGIVLEDIAD